MESEEGAEFAVMGTVKAAQEARAAPVKVVERRQAVLDEQLGFDSGTKNGQG
jgi:hypothetical protein